MSYQTDVIIIGAGASGLMCARAAGARARKVLVLDHAKKPGQKILMSGGGRCNFTNMDVEAGHFISSNRHFCKSAISRFTQWDFIGMMGEYEIPFHERDHGQLFCDNSASEILDMLLQECRKAGVNIQVETPVTRISKTETGFDVHTDKGSYKCTSLVVATGGLSIPGIGATAYGHQIAKQFKIPVVQPRAGLVPLTWNASDKKHMPSLSGIAVDSVVKFKNREFRENILFTHRGLSGPAILQISSYWNAGESITVNLLPGVDLAAELTDIREKSPKKKLKTVMADYLPKRVVAAMLPSQLTEQFLSALSPKQFSDISMRLQKWEMTPGGTEGYRTAEVTVGGVSCDAVSSKTMEALKVPGLFFIGEVLDVAGWLGGYNLQWAWASGWCCGQYV